MSESSANILKINKCDWNLIKEQVTLLQEAKEIKENTRLALQINSISFVISRVETENRIKPSGKRKRTTEHNVDSKRRKSNDDDVFFVKTETDSDIEIVEDEPELLLEVLSGRRTSDPEATIVTLLS